MKFRLPTLFMLAALLAACADETAVAPTAATADAAKAEPGIEWSRCRIPGLATPVGGRLFVVDGGEPTPDAEPGRESIRRVDVLVPGDVSLFLTAPDASAWLVRLSPETRLRGVFASGEQMQRVTGQGLGKSRLEKSQAMGDDCGRYWLKDGADEALGEATDQLFGRPHDAIYRMHAGQVVIGGPESALPESVAPSR